MKQSLPIKLLVALLLPLFVGSCAPDEIYNKSQDVAPLGWNMNNPLTFNLDADDTSHTCLCCIDLRLTEDYPYSNIYLNIVTRFPNGDIAADTNLEFQLATPDGQWLGHRQGRYIDGRYPFCYFRFPSQGIYQFQIAHAMRDSLLPGVKDVGLHIATIETE